MSLTGEKRSKINWLVETNEFSVSGWVGRDIKHKFSPFAVELRVNNEPAVSQLSGSIAAAQQIKNRPNGRFLIWLGRQGSNLRMLVPKTSALPLGDDPLTLYDYNK